MENAVRDSIEFTPIMKKAMKPMYSWHVTRREVVVLGNGMRARAAASTLTLEDQATGTAVCEASRVGD